MTASIQLTDTTSAALETEQEPIVASASTLQITSQLGLVVAADLLTASIKPMLKKIGQEFKKPVADAHTAHKSVCALRNKLTAPLEKAEKLLKGKIAEYLDEQDRLRCKELDEIAGDTDADPEAGAVATPPPEMPHGLSSYQVWTAEVTDMKALVAAIAEGTGNPPLSLLQINKQRVRETLKGMDGAVKWPGIRVFQEWITTARST